LSADAEACEVKVISVLIPTRSRPTNLRASIASCYALANHPERVEVMVGVDGDDPLLSQVLAACDGWSIKILRAPKRYGYKHLYEYFNRLAAASKGAWLINWNDDAEMLTQGWDDLLCDAPEVAVQFLRRDEIKEADPTLPVTSRNIFEAMGHLSLNGHCDAWISDVSYWAGCQVVRNDIAFRHHCLADQTARERCDDMPWFKGPEQTALRAKDIEAVKVLVERSRK
jgi:hypothetical protein